MLDGPNWSSEKEARYENLAPANGITPLPLPLSFLHVASSLTLASMSLNPWLRPWLKLYSK